MFFVLFYKVNAIIINNKETPFLKYDKLESSYYAIYYKRKLMLWHQKIILYVIG